MRYVIMALTLALLAPTTQAQVFKCTSADGKLIYADRPCTHGRVVVLERERSWQEIAAERAVAADAEQRKYRARQDEREQQMMEHQMRLSQQRASQSTVSRSAPSSGETPACKAARKELEFVSSIRTVSQDEKRMRNNAAISNVNAACGSNTQLMQEPTKIEIHTNKDCWKSRGSIRCD